MKYKIILKEFKSLFNTIEFDIFKTEGLGGQIEVFIDESTIKGCIRVSRVEFQEYINSITANMISWGVVNLDLEIDYKFTHNGFVDIEIMNEYKSDDEFVYFSACL